MHYSVQRLRMSDHYLSLKETACLLLAISRLCLDIIRVVWFHIADIKQTCDTYVCVAINNSLLPMGTAVVYVSSPFWSVGAFLLQSHCCLFMSIVHVAAVKK